MARRKRRAGAVLVRVGPAPQEPVGDGPYKVLGVPKSAAPEQIVKAYRRRAFETHPDRNGGDDTEFRRVQAAFELLSDPGRRAKFDATGREDEPKSRSMNTALAIIYLMIDEVMVKLEQEGRTNPKKIDMALELRQYVEGKVKEQKHKVEVLGKACKQLEVMVGRFRQGENESPVNRVVRKKIDDLKDQQEREREMMEECEVALKLLKDTTYRFEKEEYKWNVGTGWDFFVNTRAV